MLIMRRDDTNYKIWSRTRLPWFGASMPLVPFSMFPVLKEVKQTPLLGRLLWLCVLEWKVLLFSLT